LDKFIKWHKDNFKEVQEIFRDAKDIEDKTGEKSFYLIAKDWIEKRAPQNENEKKYDHVTAILEQMSRNPRKLPTLEISKKPFDELTIDDFVINNYNPHPAIRRTMAV